MYLPTSPSWLEVSNSGLILIISFLLLALGFVFCCSSNLVDVSFSLFEMFLSFLIRAVLL